MEQEIESEIVEPDADMTKGYCVKFYVWEDGTFSIGEPEAVTEDEREGNAESEGENQTDLTSALKRLLNVVKQNPVGSDDEAQFAAGYNAGPGGAVNAGTL